jgi:hypothetical protein
MAYTYHWTIRALQVAPSSDGLTEVVKRVEWDYHCSNGNDASSYFGYTDLPAPDSAEFISYENLSKEDLISWIKNHVNEDELKVVVRDQLERSKKPVVETRIPNF